MSEAATYWIVCKTAHLAPVILLAKQPNNPSNFGIENWNLHFQFTLLKFLFPLISFSSSSSFGLIFFYNVCYHASTTFGLANLNSMSHIYIVGISEALPKNTKSVCYGSHWQEHTTDHSRLRKCKCMRVAYSVIAVKGYDRHSHLKNFYLIKAILEISFWEADTNSSTVWVENLFHRNIEVL